LLPFEPFIKGISFLQRLQSSSLYCSPLGQRFFPRFGWNMGVDVGVSIGPNEKVSLYDDQWTKIGGTTESQVVLPAKSSPQGQNQAMLINMSCVMSNILARFASNISPQQANGNTLVFFMPSQQRQNVVDWIYHEPKPVENLDLNQIPALLRNNLVLAQQAGKPVHTQQKPITLSPNVRLITLGDVAGGMASSVTQIARLHPDKFKPGMEAIYMMAGGGLGIGNVEYLKEDNIPGLIRLETTEEACVPVSRKLANGQYSTKVDSGGACLEGIMSNFADGLPSRFSPAQKEALRKNKNGRIATDYQQARKTLPDLNPAEHAQAAQKACREFIASLACVATMKVYSGGNLAIIAGGIAGGVRDYVNNHPEQFVLELQTYQSIPKPSGKPGEKPKSSFDQVFLATLWNQLGDKGLFLKKDFDVISDVIVHNNTDGTPYVAQGHYDNRDDRFVIPTSVFTVPASS
jgi:hypothetical protein